MTSYVKTKLLLDGQRRDEKVVLLDVAGDSGEGIRVHTSSVQIPLAVDFQFARVPKREAVEKGRLPGPTGAHDGQKFARSYYSTH